MTDNEKKTEELLSELKRVTGLDLKLPEDAAEEEDIRRLTLLLETCRKSGNRESVMQRWITGSSEKEEFLADCARLHLDQDTQRMLYYVETEAKADPSLIRFLKTALADRQGLLILPLKDHAILLVEQRKGKASRSGRETAEAVISLLNTEMFTDARAALSRPVPDALSLPEAYRETLKTMEAGRLFYPDRLIYTPEDTEEERLLYELPAAACRKYLAENLPMKGPFGAELLPDSIQAFDGDMKSAAECFMENDLNIAETARRLHMHRNTLLYRIEQIEKETGLDIRRFEDALRYRLCSLMWKVYQKKISGSA